MREATVQDIAGLVEAFAPCSLAANWDNVGLQIGGRDWPVHRVRVALDAARTVIDAAINDRADMLVTHHPLFFRPIKTLDFSTPLGRILEKAFHHRLAIYSAHTNLDRVTGGVNDTLARRLGLENALPVDSESVDEDGGFFRIGILAPPRNLSDYAKCLKERLGLPHLRFAGDAKTSIRKVALCAGSGSGFVDLFLDSDADVFVSGDLKYHDARKVEDHGRALIDIGHFYSENLFLDVWIDQLREAIDKNKWDVNVERCTGETDPFTVINGGVKIRTPV